MTLSTCLVAAFWVPLLAARPHVAPAPHLALDELVKEYKRLGLPFPPPNAELVRVKSADRPDELVFRIPTKPGSYPDIMVGVVTHSTEGLVCVADVPELAALREVEPRLVSDLLCLAVQCRERGWNEFAALLFARAQESIINPVPARTEGGDRGDQFGAKHRAERLNGWELRAGNSSAVIEIRDVAKYYWFQQVMAGDSDRKEVLRQLKELAPESEEVRDLERALAPRKSKPGTTAALVDDLADYWRSGAAAFEPPGANARGEAAYRKLVDMGFDAVPALLDAIKDERLTRTYHYVWRGGRGGIDRGNHFIVRTRVGHVAGQILNDLSGRALSNDFEGPKLDEQKVRAWWVNAQKEGEEKWLVARAGEEPGDEGVVEEGADGRRPQPPANRVVFRALGAKYPNRLGEVYRTVLRKKPELETDALADEVAASKLPRPEKLALLTEGAEHKRWVHRNAALTVLAGFDPPLFRKHLLATLKELPPDVQTRWAIRSAQAELASFVLEIGDPVYWDALAELAKRSSVGVRIKILRESCLVGVPDPSAPARHQSLRFLLRFISDESPDGPRVMEKTDNDLIESDSTPPRRVQDVAAAVLAWHLGFTLEYDPKRGPLSHLIIRAAAAKAAAEELALRK